MRWQVPSAAAIGPCAARTARGTISADAHAADGRGSREAPCTRCLHARLSPGSQSMVAPHGSGGESQSKEIVGKSGRDTRGLRVSAFNYTQLHFVMQVRGARQSRLSAPSRTRFAGLPIDDGASSHCRVDASQTRRHTDGCAADAKALGAPCGAWLRRSERAWDGGDVRTAHRTDRSAR